MAWATAADTLTYTGITVATTDITMAQAMIEIFTDVYDNESVAASSGRISTKNLRLLKLAVAYQSAWITEHPDVFTNIDINDMREGGASSGGLSFTNTHANSGVLAPMAKRCIDRLSWRRNRSWRLKARKPTNSDDGPGTAFTNDAVLDDGQVWGSL